MVSRLLSSSVKTVTSVSNTVGCSIVVFWLALFAVVRFVVLVLLVLFRFVVLPVAFGVVLLVLVLFLLV